MDERRIKLLGILKDLYKEKIISKKKYQSMVDRILAEEMGEKQPVSEKETEEKKSEWSKPQEIEIPVERFFALVRKGTKLKLMLSSGLEDLDEEKKVKVKSEMKTVEDRGEHKEDVETKEEKTDREKMKEELNLIDVKKEVKIEPKEKKEVKKIEKPSVFSRIKKIIKFKRKESEKEKLKRLSLENLERVKKLEDKKKLVIAAAAVLNDFLEVKLGIPRELTHNELANELEKREMKDELLKNQLIDFFRRLAVEEYTDRLDMEDPDEVVNLAEMAINELSKT